MSGKYDHSSSKSGGFSRILIEEVEVWLLGYTCSTGYIIKKVVEVSGKYHSFNSAAEMEDIGRQKLYKWKYKVFFVGGACLSLSL